MLNQSLVEFPETFTAMAPDADAGHAADGAESNAALVRRFLHAMTDGGGDRDLTEFFCDDVIGVEFPNRFTPKGARSDLEAMREAGERGRRVCPAQHYEIRTIMAVGNLVAVEMEWIATVSVPVGTIPAGGEMRAQFAAFYEMRDGRIAAIRNYDCFQEF